VPEVAESLAGREKPSEHWAAVDRVPTLTEVVELDSVFPSTQIPPDETGLDSSVMGSDDVARMGSNPSATTASALSAEVLFELEQRIGSVLDARLREALAPALARAADLMIREARQELAQTLRGLVDEAVTRALERRTHL
jgi:hypothetical protein